jgi:hypothetical protein
MLELFILAAAFAGGYAASVVSWPWVRARAEALRDSIKGAL